MPEVIFELEIPQIMSVMSALVFAMMLGLAATWTKAKLITGLLDEFQKIDSFSGGSDHHPHSSVIYRHYLLRPCLRRNHHQTAACFSEDHRTGACRALIWMALLYSLQESIPEKILWMLSAIMVLPI